VDRNADEATVEEVRSRAEAALARIREGASFEDVALELSEDPGSVDQGGDLGFFARGERTPVLEEAAFSQQPMEVSEVVRSDVGFHIVRTEEHRAGGELGFEQASLELGGERAARERAREIAEGLSEEIAAAVREGASLEDAARGKGLTLTRTAMLKRRPDHFIPGLGASAEVMATAFSLDLESPSSARIFRVDSKLVLIQLLARTDPDGESLAAATATQREQLLAQKRDRLVQDWVAHTRAALVDQNRLVVNTALVNSRR
jgi:parvulin-like peptidyl-prolyl isomerase